MQFSTFVEIFRNKKWLQVKAAIFYLSVDKL